MVRSVTANGLATSGAACHGSGTTSARPMLVDENVTLFLCCARAL